MDNIKEISNEKLCEIVVCNRYLGILKDAAIICMTELAARRSEGNIFNYEEYIENLTKSLPNFNINLKALLK